MAYKKQTWTNDRNQHYQKHGVGGFTFRSVRETNGNPLLAVDGVEEPLEWSKCSTIDNYFIEKPIWMVDLGRRTNVAGVMLRTWHDNKGSTNRKKSFSPKDYLYILLFLEVNSSLSVYRDYLKNLDRYSIYVDHYPRRYRFKDSKLCSSITRTSQTLTSSFRLHFQCQHPLYGRFVYIQAHGGYNHWNKLFTAVLCEVFVYEQ